MGGIVFYELNDEIITTDINSINSGILTVGLIGVEKLPFVAEKMCFSNSTVMMCNKDKRYFRSDIQVCDNYIFGIFKIIDVGNIAFYIKNNLFLVVDVDCTGNALRDILLSALNKCNLETVCVQKVAVAFFESVINGDGKHIEDMQRRINAMEEIVEKDRVKNDFNLRLFEMKKRLLDMRNYYEQLIDIAEALEDNARVLFDDEKDNHFATLEKKAARLKECVDVLRDNVVHIKDAYQSYLELKLNQTMKVFTVFTVIFLPLTLITGWYGMNFSYMPEIRWKYGYAFVITLSLVVVGVFIFVFKKKRWI